MNNLRETISSYLGLVFKVGLILVILSTLFLFTNLTTEFYETAKFIVLLFFTGVVLVLLTVRFTLTSKVVFIRTILDIPLLLLLAVGIVSTILAPSPFISLLGNQLKVHGSLVSILVYVLLYFILVNNLKTLREAKWVLGITTFAAGILALISLITYAGVRVLPPPWSHGVNFTPTGSAFSTTAVMSMLLPLVLINILQHGNLLFKLINAVILFLMGVTIALTGSSSTWIAAVFSLVVTFFVLQPIKDISQIKPLTLLTLLTPLVLIILVVVLSFIPPMGGAQNPLYEKAKNFPREVQLSFPTSWKISVSAFRDAPFWGSGPSSYLFDFTNYKPIEFNQSKVWNLRFDSSFNEYLEVLATLGGVGLVALLSLTLLFVSAAWQHLRGEATDVTSSTHLGGGLKSALAVSGLTFFVLLALHASSLSLWIFGILILASFMVANKGDEEKRWGGSGNFSKDLFRIAGNLSASNSSQETVRIDALPGILLILSLALILFGFYFGSKFALADYHHRQALNAVAQNSGIVAYNELILAEKLNPYNDLYRTDLAQTNFALANAIASAKGPTEASPSGSLTVQDQQNIQVLLQQSINEGRNAVALSPKSAINWEILGLLYRQISGVAQNALVFSLDAYGRAIFQDPLNPLLRLNVGGTYYAIKNYDLAIRFFTDAINLKPDFANGYYNLSVALRDKGDLAGAQVAAEKALELVDKNSADYKIASDLLSDLKSKSESKVAPPAAQTGGALQEEKLPKVVNVGNPPQNIATPSAVKKPNSTPEPSPTP